MRLVGLVLLAAALAACSSQPKPRFSNQVIDRALRGAPGQAQPSKIVAAEIAFARAATEQGQWTAFRSFAAPGALIHGKNGPVVAKSWLAGRKDPDEAVQWEPRSVWMSCNGAAAVSQGRFRDPQGQVGTYVTVWQRQSDGSYLWTYDMGAPDNPQPPPRPPQPAPREGDIVVEAMDAVAADYASCAARGAIVPMTQAGLPDGASGNTAASRDGTLRWSWTQFGDGQRLFSASLWKDDRWETALEFAVSADGTTPSQSTRTR